MYIAATVSGLGLLSTCIVDFYAVVRLLGVLTA